MIIFQFFLNCLRNYLSYLFLQKLFDSRCYYEYYLFISRFLLTTEKTGKEIKVAMTIFQFFCFLGNYLVLFMFARINIEKFLSFNY